MRAHLLMATVVAVSGCGLELIGANLAHGGYLRPASVMVGTTALADGTITITDSAGNELEPFEQSRDGGWFELRLPSARYTNLVLQHRSGNVQLRTLVPQVGEESAVELDLAARPMTEALITEARLSGDGKAWKQVTPEAYVATRELMRQGMDTPGPTRDLFQVVERLIALNDPQFSGDPFFFERPVLAVADGGVGYTTTTSALTQSFVASQGFDFDGDGRPSFTSFQFDRLLEQVAAQYRPAGCPDPTRIRIVFTVDFNPGRLNGNCGVSERFKWAVDKPGKQMFFVGWLHADSPIQDTLVTALLGNGVPNQVPMRDDGSGGDEVSGDNIWTVYFDVPRGARIGYKYTWGIRGASWSGNEEWPGNSRIIEAVDVNGDDIVYRRDVFGDEATNKDRSNLNLAGTGVLNWGDRLRSFGVETRELPVDVNNDCVPANFEWITPESVGPLTVACTQ